MSLEDYLERAREDSDWMDERVPSAGCIFPGKCIMPGEHFPDECCTVSMMEQMYEDGEA